MIYRHRFQVSAPLEKVAQFHSRPVSMAAITPPPVFIQLQHAPTVLQEGDEMAFTMWLGPFPLRWLARIETVSPTGFTDRQIKGPFAQWIHQHSFVPKGEGLTEIIDQVTLQPPAHPLGRLLALVMRLGLPILFAYRGWKTRGLLQ